MTSRPPASHPSFADSARELAALLEASAKVGPAVDAAGECLFRSLQAGGKVLTCGNGGSAADAMHLAEEFVGRFQQKRRALPAICLCADSTVLTCVGNDFGFEQIFARGIEAHGRPGDVLVAFSTSGNSANVVAALEKARAVGVTSILISGRDGGRARALCDHALIVPGQKTSRIQEIHMLILHQLLEAADAHVWD
ncbi:D-sedoheptulose-7-phosphate isomerase [Opitutus terrae]|uniref:Phosphoheptose isomerase n=1 Tax=Opitutus terrae (strain DSM 11246 / JCM 15787 / PB90-1) TaxID=452637 RepID=B1ZRP8_OPITP|nr:SIS domain-containing protein [Opitutus terrae]ACB73741.1 phosphoheptose isomerase [Opitutus terrae PB90-1]